MEQLLPIKMSKFDNQPWGFRLHGGTDFASPLAIQKVSVGSLAEKAGLQVGDAILKINGKDVFQLRHKEAKDEMVRAGNNFEVLVRRNGVDLMPMNLLKSTMAPVAEEVPVVEEVPVAAPAMAPAAEPLSTKIQTPAGNITLVNKQFNTPMGLYSEETIAEMLSSQAEVLVEGVLGVNFKKNEKKYSPIDSEVLRMVLDMDRQPKEPELAAANQSERPMVATAGLRPVPLVKPQAQPALITFEPLPSALKGATDLASTPACVVPAQLLSGSNPATFTGLKASNVSFKTTLKPVYEPKKPAAGPVFAMQPGGHRVQWPPVRPLIDEAGVC